MKRIWIIQDSIKNEKAFKQTGGSDGYYWGTWEVYRKKENLNKLKRENTFSRREKSVYLGYIESGSFKYVAYTKNGEEKIVGLETVGGFVANWPYCLQKLSSPIAIIANTDSVISTLSVSKIIKRMDKDPDFEKLVNLATKAMFYTIYERMIDLYTKTPKERYGKMLDRCPQMFEIFSLKDIPSYLNITPTHLSRLRKK